MTVAELLRDIAETRIGLAPSPIHGIGVFALAAIPKGARDLFSPPGEEWPGISHAEIEALPPAARKLVETYCLDDGESVYLPARGFKVVDLVMFLNHSDTPNLAQRDGGNWFEALRDIAEGEELTVDYGTLETE